MRHNGESQTEVTKKQSTADFRKNEHFISPDTQVRIVPNALWKSLSL